MDYRDQRPILTIIGTLFFFVGFVSAFLGPVEMYVFYLFSEGGRFHYEGFGFGSFMFGNLAVQIAGYYLIALLCIPLGYGHVRVRRWARTLFLTLLRCWLVVGVPLMIIFLLVLFSAKDLAPVVALAVTALLLLSYPLVPLVLIRFYNGTSTKKTFEIRDPNTYWIERQPLQVLVLGALFVFYAIVLHVPILFNGLVPFFGQWLSGLQGIVVLTILIMSLLCLTWGILNRWAWAWWGSLVYFGLLTVSTVLTLAGSSYLDLLTKMDFPAAEFEMLDGVPVSGLHLAAFVGLPLVLTLVAIVVSKRCFGKPGMESRLNEDRQAGE
jgi:hypothetical protein